MRDVPRTVAHGRNELIRAIKVIGELDIVLINGKIDDGAVAANVEDPVVIGCADGFKNFGVLELVLDDGILQELDAFGVGERLERRVNLDVAAHKKDEN